MFWFCLLFPQQSFSFCTPQDCLGSVSHAGDFAGGMLCTFVESFQGQYKDGTNGTRDFRMVSTTFLILRIVILASFLNRHTSGVHPVNVNCWQVLLVSMVLQGHTS